MVETGPGPNLDVESPYLDLDWPNLDVDGPNLNLGQREGLPASNLWLSVSRNKFDQLSPMINSISINWGLTKVRATSKERIERARLQTQHFRSTYLLARREPKNFLTLWNEQGRNDGLSCRE